MEARTGSLDRDGERIYYELRGAGPPLVLIHGALMDRRMWKWQVDALVQRFTAITYDVPGHGRSDVPLSPRAHHEDLLRLLDYLRVPAAGLQGFSMGAAIAIDLALESPERVTSLTLVSPTVSGARYSPEFVDQSLALRETAHDAGAEMARWIIREDPFWAFLVPEQKHAAARTLFFQILGDNLHSLLMDPDRLLYAEPPALGRIGEIRVPTLVIAGERDHPDNRAVASALVEGIKAAELVEIRGAGHAVNLEQPLRHNLAVGKFLADAGRLRSPSPRS